MKKRVLTGCIGLMFAGLFCAQTKKAGPQRQSPATTAASAAAQRALLDQYCVTCHNDKAKTANLSLQNLDLSTAGNHLRVVGKSRA